MAAKSAAAGMSTSSIDFYAVVSSAKFPNNSPAAPSPAKKSAPKPKKQQAPKQQPKKQQKKPQPKKQAPPPVQKPKKVESAPKPPPPPPKKVIPLEDVNVDFIWPHGGVGVVLKGEFLNNWQGSIIMTRSGDVFKASMSLESGKKYKHKFVVDGVWKCDHTKEVLIEDDGNENNLIVACEREGRKFYEYRIKQWPEGSERFDREYIDRIRSVIEFDSAKGHGPSLADLDAL